MLAYSYAKLYNIPSTGLRFFTVYGPAGRPDMAYFGFTNTLRSGGTIKIFNYGNCKRDFTYIDDIVEGVSKVMCAAPERRNGADGLPDHHMLFITLVIAILKISSILYAFFQKN